LDHTGGVDPAGGEEWHGGSEYDELMTTSTAAAANTLVSTTTTIATPCTLMPAMVAMVAMVWQRRWRTDTDDTTDTDAGESTSADEMDVGEGSDEADGGTGQMEAPPVHTLPKEFFAGHSDGNIDLTCLDETVKILDPAHVKVMLARARVRMKDLDDVAACLCCDRQVLAREVCTYPLNSTGVFPVISRNSATTPGRLKLDPGLRQMYKLPIARDGGMVAARLADEFGWQRLLASPRAVRTADQSVAICKPCYAALKRKKTTHPL
jgi:hypothetical protein